MVVNTTIFKELLKRGYSLRGDKRVWDISDSKLWFLTPKLAEGFINLKGNLEFYRKSVIEPELNLLKDNAKKIANSVKTDKFNLIDLSSTTGGRAEALLKSMPNNVKVRYCPIAASSHLLDIVSEKIRPIADKVAEIRPFISDLKDFEDILGILRGSKYTQNIVMMLGSRISHYEINEILFDLSSSMFKDDVLVIGNGIRQGERFVEINKYKNSFFNDWFINIMRELGFQDSEVEYDARFENHRVEGFYRIKVDKIIEFNGKRISFKKGDEIVIAVHYKFYEAELVDFCRMYFCDVEVIKTEDGGHCLLLCRK